jgi:hypothetical protein
MTTHTHKVNERESQKYHRGYLIADIIEAHENGEMSDQLYNDIYESLVYDGEIGSHNSDDCDDLINERVKGLHEEL